MLGASFFLGFAVFMATMKGFTKEFACTCPSSITDSSFLEVYTVGLSHYHLVGEDDSGPARFAYFRYYQTITVLFGLAFGATTFLWSWLEQGEVMVLTNSTRGQFISNKVDRDNITKPIAEYILHSETKFYFLKYLFCFVVKGLIILAQIGGVLAIIGTPPQISQIISNVWTEAGERSDVLSEVFPHLFTFTFSPTGSTGARQRFVVTCTSGINVLLEHFFLAALYLNSVFLAIWICDLAKYLFKYTFFSFSHCRGSNSIRNQLNKVSYNQMTLLILLEQNMDKLTFESLLSHVGKASNDLQVGDES